MSSARPWKQAWQDALYADDGFFRTQRPGDHFETATQLPGYAAAMAELARRCHASQVVDMAAGGGELISALRSLLPDTELIGVDLAPRPANLDPSIAWTNVLPDHVHGVLIANEWLDNIACDVVEVDRDGVCCYVKVDPATGVESLGAPADDDWLDRWWPLTEPGERAEVGEPRDVAWADAAARVDGVAVAVDYGHLISDRPPFGSLRSYAHGHECEVIPDGTRDVTAHVAVDSVAVAASATLLSQRDALRALGMSSAHPPLALARNDPAEYLHQLASASESGHLTARGGYGDFWWIITDTSGHGTLSP